MTALYLPRWLLWLRPAAVVARAVAPQTGWRSHILLLFMLPGGWYPTTGSIRALHGLVEVACVFAAGASDLVGVVCVHAVWALFGWGAHACLWLELRLGVD